jgi:hypothetical protein
MNTLLRVLNSFLLAGMLAVLILIFLRVREPISVTEPVAVTIDSTVMLGELQKRTARNGSERCFRSTYEDEIVPAGLRKRSPVAVVQLASTPSRAVPPLRRRASVETDAG